MTSTGVTAVEGKTIAVDPTVIPYGSTILINGNEYIAEEPDIHLIAMELVATSEDGIECRVQGSQLTKDLLEDLEISNEELDMMLRPAAACLKSFAETLIERMEKKDEERINVILDKLLKILN